MERQAAKLPPRLRAEAMRKARQDPDRPRVKLRPHKADRFFLDAFGRLSTERLLANGCVMAIPWSAVYRYGSAHGLTGPVLTYFVDVIQAMDAIDRRRIEREAEQARRNDRFAERTVRR